MLHHCPVVCVVWGVWCGVGGVEEGTLDVTGWCGIVCVMGWFFVLVWHAVWVVVVFTILMLCHV